MIEDTNDLNEEVGDSQAGLKKERDDALQLAQENLSGWKRAQADLENYRRRKEAESSEMINLGKSAAFVQMLPVLDSLQQAMIHAPDLADEKYTNWKNGLMGIVKQIESTLNDMGIKKIEAVGKLFDPNLHEAIREVPGDQEGMVAEEYQTGYTLNDKLLRPAQVAIIKKAL